MQVRLIAKTMGLEEYAGRSIDEIIVGQARLSSGKIGEELFDRPDRLLRHCIMHGHWSVFSMANLSFEITTSRAMGRELLRHWSIRPQEFSQRYAAQMEFEPIELRTQAKNNRQSSSVVVDDPKLNDAVSGAVKAVFDCYEMLLENGVARETARLILPEATQTKICMNGSIREWITMLNVRLHNTAQKECREIAQVIRDVVIQECPIVSAALFNFEGAEDMHILDRLVLEKYGVYQQAIDHAN
jgi:thymidylate synthase (FAD)